MTPEKQKRIDQIHRISDWCIKIILLGGLVIMFFSPGAWFWWVAGISLAVAIVVNTVVSHWATDEEKEQQKAELKQILQELEAEKKKADVPITPNYSPLFDLTAEQAEQIKQLLRDLPPNSKNSNAINMALMAQYLTALEQLGKANLNDKRNLRLWVGQLTGREVPPTSPFNEAFANASKAKIAHARRELESLF